jgi:predicted metal-dependent hydrolase
MDDYQLIHTRRKTIRLTVERDNRLVVRAPEGTTAAQIEDVLARKALWLYRQRRHRQRYPAAPPRKEFVTGETLLYSGRHYRLEVVDEPLDGVRFCGRFQISRSQCHRAGEMLCVWYESRAEQRLTARVRAFARQLGVAYNRLLVSDLKYRWGSCTAQNTLNFNWRIIKAPAFVLDYLVVHELAHLIEPNHTRRFWNVVAVQVPKWQEAKTWLRENGALLERDF